MQVEGDIKYELESVGISNISWGSLSDISWSFVIEYHPDFHSFEDGSGDQISVGVSGSGSLKG